MAPGAQLSRAVAKRFSSDVGRTPAGGLVLIEGRSHSAIVGVPSRARAGAVLVVPGDAANSYLLNKLSGVDITGQRMPRGGPFLSDGQIRIIRRWIELGADNN